MNVPLFQVDAFTDQPFAGNPAAVCLLPRPQPDAWMQAVAAEMNLSETAFLVEEGDGYRLRWFTPKVEVDLCGHATLASAHVLWAEGRVPLDTAIRFHTKSGLLKAVRRNELIELDFPLDPPSATSPPPDLLPALGIAADYVGKGKFDLLVEVESEEIVRSLTPDFARLAKIEARGVLVTGRSSSPALADWRYPEPRKSPLIPHLAFRWDRPGSYHRFPSFTLQLFRLERCLVMLPLKQCSFTLAGFARFLHQPIFLRFCVF